MNCAESRDLILDLAYGELPPARAAEVEAHVLDCAECRAERDQLDDARKAAAPLRELEELPAGFDEPILRAARAEAGLQADGTPGPVVEVSASVKPLGLQAARLDPHARMRGGTARPGPRWARRVAVFGSIAGVAGLALVVTSSLTRHRADQTAEEVPPIQVHAPGTNVPIPLDDRLAPQGNAVAPEAGSGARAPEVGPPPPARAADAAKRKLSSAPEPAQERAARREKQAPAAAQESHWRALLSEERFKAPQKAVGPPSREGVELEPRQEPRPEAAPSSGESKGAGAARATAGGLHAAPAVQPPAAPVVAGQLAAPANPDRLELEASAARRRGDYARAAALYREASALRRQSEPAQAAWDMAHAVECLAAGGQVNEAVAVRKELVRAFPDHSGPKAAADSALRSVPLPPDEERPASTKE